MTTHIAVCGAGAFGRNHVRIYNELAASGLPVQLTAIVDPSPHVQASVPASAPQPQLFPTVEAMLAARAAGTLEVDAASVCVPTSFHHAVSRALLAANIDVLVEKPITSTLVEADDLIQLAAVHKRVLMVGHLERFNPAVVAVAPLLRGPMFFEAHRLSVFSPRSLDVDVVLDLMIHDLDIVLQLAQSPVAHVHAVGLPILSQKTDIANVRVEFRSGCVANFTASRVSTERVRKLRFFQPHQYLSIDYARQDLLVIEVQPPAPRAATPLAVNPRASVPGAVSPGAPGSAPETSQAPASALPNLGMHKPEVTPGEPLRLEIEAFLHAVTTSSPPPVTGEQARAALALALDVQAAIERHAQHAGLQAFTQR